MTTPTCRFGAWSVALLALLPSASALGGESDGTQVGQWVRIQTGPELRSEELGITQRAGAGFQVLPPAQFVSDNHFSVTIDIGGRRVRVLKPGTEFQGVVKMLDERTLVFGGPEPPVTVPWGSVAKVDLRSRKSRKGRGALIGALAGAAVGAIVAAGSGSGSNGGMGFDGASWAAGAGGVVGASVGALVGLLVAPGDSWQEDVNMTQLKRPARSASGR